MRYVAFTPINKHHRHPRDQPSLATDSNGLPIGIHFMADMGNERMLLELAYELEAPRSRSRINA